MNSSLKLLNVQYEAVLRAAEGLDAEKEAAEGHHDARRNEVEVGKGALDNEAARLLDIKMHRVQVFNDPSRLCGKYGYGIEDGGKVHPGGDDGVVDVLDISEKNVQRRKQQRHPQAEKVQLENRKRQKENMPSRPGARRGHDYR